MWPLSLPPIVLVASNLMQRSDIEDVVSDLTVEVNLGE